MKKFYESPITHKAAAFICGLCILFILLITSVQALCYWIPDWWRNEYAKYDTPSNVNGEMSLDDAVSVTEDMLEYCIGRLDTLDNSMATIDGVTQPFYTDREKAHLADCRELFGKAIRARVIAVLLLVALTVFIYIHNDYPYRRFADDAEPGSTAAYSSEACSSEISRRKPGSTTAFEAEACNTEVYSAGAARRKPGSTAAFEAEACSSEPGGQGCSRTLRLMAGGYLKALAFTAVLAVIVGIFCLIDFTQVFTIFHHIFFDNDLWILYPDQDNLINIMQEQVFSDAAMWIAGIWLSAAALLAVISVFILRRRPHFSRARAQ